MTPDAWPWLRWLIVLGVCAVVVLVAVPLAIDSLSRSVVLGDAVGDAEDGEDTEEPDSDGASTPTGEVASGPVTAGDAAPDADFVVRGGVVDDSAASSLALSAEGDELVAVFPLIDGDPGCVATAELAFQLEEADATEVGVYAAHTTAVPDDGDEVGDLRRDDTLHAVALTDGTPGRLRWDVTNLYRSWASADLAPPGTPFAVVVTALDPAAEVTFASSEAGADSAPLLEWDGEPGCGDTASGRDHFAA